MIATHLARVLTVLLFVSAATYAQKPAATPETDEQRKSRLEVEAKAIGLLGEVIKEAETFKAPENRLRLHMAAADLLWPHDEVRARALLKATMASLADQLSEPTDGDVSEMFGPYGGVRVLRSEMLVMLSKRDPRLAREFLRATRPAPDKATARREPMADAEMQMDLSFATRVAATDPNLAVDIGIEILGRGLAYQLPNLVSEILQKDPEAASKLATEIVARLKVDKLDSSTEARHVAIHLLKVAAERSEAVKPGESARKPLLDQATLAELTEMVVAESLRPSPHAAELLESLRTMMPVVERYAPNRVEQLQKQIPNRSEREDASGETTFADELEALEPLMMNGSAEEILAAAPKASEEVREILYQSAVSKLVQAGQNERARQLIEEKIDDPEQRKQLLTMLDSGATNETPQVATLTEAHKSVASLKTNDDQASALANMAVAATQKGDKKLALELLEDARGLIAPRPKTAKQLGAHLAVALAYAALDPGKSFAILEPIVEQLNELVAAAAVLGGFFVEGLIKDDEIQLGPVLMFSGLYGPNVMVAVLGNMDVLARADFGRMREIVDKFQRPEIRIMMRLVLAHIILAPKEGAVESNVGRRTGKTLSNQ